MSKREELLEKARNNPKGLSFEEFLSLLSHSGWVHDRTVGSHQIWYSPSRHRLSVQPASNGKAKAYQVEQFLTQLDKEIGNG